MTCHFGRGKTLIAKQLNEIMFTKEDDSTLRLLKLFFIHFKFLEKSYINPNIPLSLLICANNKSF